MDTADFDHNIFAEGNRSADSKLAIRFFTKAKQDMEKTQEVGHPQFREVDYIQIMVPGDRNQAVVRPVAPADKIRFERQYEHWKKTQSNEVVVGTPLEAWNILTLSQIEEFRYFGVRTIEHMADLRDDVAGKITGAVSLKQKATAFIALMKEEAPMKKVQAELDKRDAEISSMKTSMAEMAEAMRKLQNPVKKAA